MSLLSARPFVMLYIHLRTLFAYPKEMLISYLTLPIQLIVMVSLFDYLSRFYIGRVDYVVSLCYIILAAFYTRILFLEDVSITIANDVFNGFIDKYLTKPMNILTPYVYRSYARRLFGLTILIPTALIALYVFKLKVSLYRLLLFIALSHLSYALNFLINCTIGFLSIYTHRVYGIKDVLDTINFILSGQLLPIYMYPEPVKLIAMYMPFQAIVYVPLKALLIGVDVKAIAMSLLYMLVLSLALLIIIKSFSRRYESAMG